MILTSKELFRSFTIMKHSIIVYSLRLLYSLAVVLLGFVFIVSIVRSSILYTASHVLYAMCGVRTTLGYFMSRCASNPFFNSSTLHCFFHKQCLFPLLVRVLPRIHQELLLQVFLYLMLLLLPRSLPVLLLLYLLE